MAVAHMMTIHDEVDTICCSEHVAWVGGTSLPWWGIMWTLRQMWLMIMDLGDFSIHVDTSLYGLCNSRAEAGNMSILMLELVTLCDAVWWCCRGWQPFRVGENVRPMSCALFGEGCTMGEWAMSWGNRRVGVLARCDALGWTREEISKGHMIGERWAGR